MHEVGDCHPVRDGEGHTAQWPVRLLARMASRQSRRVLPVSCMHTRTGDSSSAGSGSSVAGVVTVMVGAGTTPWVTDQMDAAVPSSVEQYTVLPLAVVPVLPTGEQSAPTTATAGAADAVVAVVVGSVGDTAGAAGGASAIGDVADGVGGGL